MKRWLFHTAAIALVLAMVAGALLVLDVYAHNRLAQYAAVNIWGYRGPVVGRKQPGERRVLVVGGSTAFGVGFPPEEAFPAKLERKLRAQSPPSPITVINLGFPGENAYAFRPNLEDYTYLKPDLVMFYGDNNVVLTAPIVLRRESAVFRLTGYYPILPTALREKALSLHNGGDLGAAYRGDKVVFQPGLATRTGASALAEAAAVTDALHKVLGPLTRKPAQPPPEMRTCGQPWTPFCDAMFDAIAYARSQGHSVLVVNQPYMSDRHIEEQQALQSMLKQRFSADLAVHYVDLGWAVDLSDPAIAYDGAHLRPLGNDKIADQLVEPVRALLAARERPGH